MYSDEELLMLSGLQHLSFCERQWALIHLEQNWTDSYDTARGDIFHERVHLEGFSSSKGVVSIRSMMLTSYKLGLSGIADIVEFTKEEKGAVLYKGVPHNIFPVEYKVGNPKKENWDRIQVCAQAICLEEMFDCSIAEGFLFYGKTRRRESIDLDSSLRQLVVDCASRMHFLFEKRETPKAARDNRCKRCSLQDICLPRSSERSPKLYWKNIES